jgi:P27 family predicted phage terminase small subunit
MPGPAPAPANIRLLKGRSEGHDVAGRPVKPPPAFKRLPPKPPTWMSREAKAEWRRVLPELSRLDLVKKEDRAALTTYCETWATYVDMLKAVREQGAVVKNTSVRKDGTESTWWTKNPAVAVMEKASQQLRGWAQEFGLTPSAEGRLVRDGGRNDPESEAENPFV